MTQEVWYQKEAGEVAQQLGVDPGAGLSSNEAKERLKKYGSNKMADAPTVPGWRKFLAQYKDFMQIILLVAGLASIIFVHDIGTGLLLIVLTVFNAFMGLHQEAKAEASLASLQKMMKLTTRVRRDGETTEIGAEEVVPGDILLFEAGDIVAADGRLTVAASLEIEESALTGESTPVPKTTDPVPGKDVALGDRINMAYMNSAVTRGRGEMIVTATGMETEVGHIANMLNTTVVEKTPLQKQLDGLTVIIASLAGIALVLVVLLGLRQGQDIGNLFIVGVALAVAAIPTGLPAVVTTLLSFGTTELAKHRAIVKRLPSVETLGSTSAICSDKTGTLTLNKMTSRELVIPDGRFTVTGEGYSIDGKIKRVGGQSDNLEPSLMAMALCTDAVLDEGSLVGDPTEGALIVLAEKGGIDVNLTRQAYPRVAELPFDSDYKMMATFHEMKTPAGEPVIRGYIKGAPDVIIARSTDYQTPEGAIQPLPAQAQERIMEANDSMASKGLRVLVLAQREFDPATFDPDADLLTLMENLTLLGLVGMVDPPRAEAKQAIAESKSAGIQVRMITGDHVVTAAAIAKELGMEGRALTGAEFAAMPDDQLKNELDEISVIARVAPEDKVRLVRLLQEKENVVAMTGDGVNDAPALKKADIGVAMGITGTEVSKGAADMILTDDNFATIVEAVSFGRALYDNLLKFIRFQMATLVGFIFSFLAAGFFQIAGGVPFGPIQILWINWVIDGPIGVALGFGKPTSGLMKQPPRKVNDPIITKSVALRLLYQGVVMTVGILALRQWAEGAYGDAAVAATMSLMAFVFYHIINGLENSHRTRTIFSMETFNDRRQIYLYGFVVVAMILGSEMGFFQRIMDTAGLTLNQWLIAAAVALPLLILEEALKFVLRQREKGKKAAA
jgi:Ca2+-transporting ATPase